MIDTIALKTVDGICRIAGAYLALLAQTAVAQACPFCDSNTGVTVRSAIFGAEFVANLCAVLSPFLLLFGLVSVMHFAWQRPFDTPR
jgi:hypothetical protein